MERFAWIINELWVIIREGSESRLALEERCQGESGGWGEGLSAGEGAASQGMLAPWKLRKQ